MELEQLVNTLKHSFIRDYAINTFSACYFLKQNMPRVAPTSGNLTLRIGALLQDWKKKRIIIPEYQRGFVWTTPIMQQLIETILIYQEPVQDLWFRQVLDDEGIEIFHLVDGHQRLTTCKRFTENKFHIKYKEKDTFFKDLPKSLQNRFLDAKLSVKVLYNYTEQAIWRIFSRLQNSKPLSIQDKAKALKYGLNDFIATAESVKHFQDVLRKRQVRFADAALIQSLSDILVFALKGIPSSINSIKWEYIQRSIEEIGDLTLETTARCDVVMKHLAVIFEQGITKCLSLLHIR